MLWVASHFFRYSSDYLSVALLTAQMKPVEQTDVLISEAPPVLMQLQSFNFVNDKLTVMRLNICNCNENIP